MRPLLNLLAWLLLATHAFALDPVLPNPVLTPGDSLPQFFARRHLCLRICQSTSAITNRVDCTQKIGF